MSHLFESIKRIFNQDGSVTWEGATGILRISGDASEGRLTQYLVRLCKEALDRSARSLIDRDAARPAANRIEVSLRIAGRDRALHVQELVNDLHEELEADLTHYALQQQYTVWKGRVLVPPIAVEASDDGEDEIRVRPRRDRTASTAPGSPAERATREERAALNQPADPSVLSSGRETVHSGEGIAQPFTLRVRERGGEPVAYPVMTPFYFGRRTKGLQIEFDFTGEEMISGEHFSILYLQEVGFTLRDNKSTNGTLVVRSDEAVRLLTSFARRDTDFAKEMRLKPGDVIRLDSGSPAHRGAAQFAFTLDGGSMAEGATDAGIRWADDLGGQGIQWRDARELVLQRLVGDPHSTAPPEEYTPMIGDSYLGSSITGALWVAYREDDDRFRDGRALARVTNFSRCTVTWLREEIPARLNGQPLRPGDRLSVPGDSILMFGGGSGEPIDVASATRVRFQWIGDREPNT